MPRCCFLMAILFFSLFTTGCLAPTRPPSAPADNWTQTQLFFGLSKPDGTLISDAEWQSFSNELATAFPDGLSILHADGLYLETRTTKPEPRREPSRIVILCYPATDPTANTRIQSLCQKYMQRFNQLDILRTDTPIHAALLTQPLH